VDISCYPGGKGIATVAASAANVPHGIATVGTSCCLGGFLLLNTATDITKMPVGKNTLRSKDAVFFQEPPSMSRAKMIFCVHASLMQLLLVPVASGLAMCSCAGTA